MMNKKTAQLYIDQLDFISRLDEARRSVKDAIRNLQLAGADFSLEQLLSGELKDLYKAAQRGAHVIRNEIENINKHHCIIYNPTLVSIDAALDYAKKNKLIKNRLFKRGKESKDAREKACDKLLNANRKLRPDGSYLYGAFLFIDGTDTPITFRINPSITIIVMDMVGAIKNNPTIPIQRMKQFLKYCESIQRSNLPIMLARESFSPLLKVMDFLPSNYELLITPKDTLCQK